MRRFFNLDIWRGMAVVMMIIYHFGFDLYSLRLASFNFHTPFWFWFPRVIVFFFLFAVGVSLTIVHRQRPKWAKAKKRIIQLGISALIISLTTYILYPKNWIYFGTLHCITFAIILGIPLVNRRKITLFIMISIITSYFAIGKSVSQLSLLPHIRSLDYIPIYPWLWVVCLGILCSDRFLKLKPLPVNKLNKGLSFLGQHSLLIYLTHQVILFGSLWAFKKLVS